MRYPVLITTLVSIAYLPTSTSRAQQSANFSSVADLASSISKRTTDFTKQLTANRSLVANLITNTSLAEASAINATGNIVKELSKHLSYSMDNNKFLENQGKQINKTNEGAVKTTHETSMQINKTLPTKEVKSKRPQLNGTREEMNERASIKSIIEHSKDHIINDELIARLTSGYKGGDTPGRQIVRCMYVEDVQTEYSMRIVARVNWREFMLNCSLLFCFVIFICFLRLIYNITKRCSLLNWDDLKIIHV